METRTSPLVIRLNPEDGVVIAGLALAIAHPWIALVVVLGASVLGALLVWWTWRALSRGLRRLFAPPAA